MPSLRRTIWLLFIFSVAMAFMETAVVIYLREIYYPQGFQFPLKIITPGIALAELLREAATIIMLIIIGVIAGKDKVQRFCFFLFCFAVWDIFYYVFLKLFLNWPESLLTWDILFLIPVPWVGPVLAPLLLSGTMIALTLLMLYFHERNIRLTIQNREWFLLILGSVVVIVSFITDYIQHLIHHGDPLPFIPQSFNWTVFCIGEVLILGGIVMMARRSQNSVESPQ